MDKYDYIRKIEKLQFALRENLLKCCWCAIGLEYEKMKNSQRQDGRYKVWGVRSWDCELYSRKIEGAI